MLRQDRRELSFLGTLLLAWGLVAAPLVHRLVSHAESPVQLGVVRSLPLTAEGHGHSHGPPSSVPGEHGQGSLEHGTALLGTPPPLPSLVLVLVALAFASPQPPSSPSVAVWPRVEKSQGP